MQMLVRSIFSPSKETNTQIGHEQSQREQNTEEKNSIKNQTIQ